MYKKYYETTKYGIPEKQFFRDYVQKILWKTLVDGNGVTEQNKFDKMQDTITITFIQI